MALLVAGVVVVLAVVVAVVAGVLVTRARRRLARELVSSREDVASLRDQVEDLSRRLGDAPAPAAGATPPREFLITTLPDAPRSDLAVPDDEQAPVVSAGRFASVAVGESVVRLLSLGYGVRRALSPENRNRIRFEMRQEVKRARRQRRRDLRDAKRHLRAQQPGGERADLRSDAA